MDRYYPPRLHLGDLPLVGAFLQETTWQSVLVGVVTIVGANWVSYLVLRRQSRKERG